MSDKHLASELTCWMALHFSQHDLKCSSVRMCDKRLFTRQNDYLQNIRCVVTSAYLSHLKPPLQDQGLTLKGKIIQVQYHYMKITCQTLKSCVKPLADTLDKLFRLWASFLVASEGGARSITRRIEFCVPKPASRVRHFAA